MHDCDFEGPGELKWLVTWLYPREPTRPADIRRVLEKAIAWSKECE